MNTPKRKANAPLRSRVRSITLARMLRQMASGVITITQRILDAIDAALEVATQ